MGAQPKLKIKEELHYRKGSTCESMNCRYCEHFVKNFPVYGIGKTGKELRIEGRCKIIGLKEGVRYRVREDCRCDKHRLRSEEA